MRLRGDASQARSMDQRGEFLSRSLVMVLFAVCASVNLTLAGEVQNLITNPDMTLEDGIGMPAGWGSRVFPVETKGRIGAEPKEDGEFDLTVEGRKSTYWWSQGGITLVPGARYRFSFEIKTSDFDGGCVSFYIRNSEWNWESQSLPSSSDTKGEWVRCEREFVAAETKRPNNYWVELSVRPGRSGKLKAEVRGLCLVAAEPEIAKASKPMPSWKVRKSVARIVPVDPLLSRVDAASGKMRFFWARASRVPGSTLLCGLDGAAEKSVKAPFDARCYAEISLGKLEPGEHSISVGVRGMDGTILATNTYRIVAGIWKSPASVGRRLNNFVTELVNKPLKDGEFEFERAEDGWTWISFDGDKGSARGYLDDCADCVVFRREGEDCIEAQRYLRAGVHKLRVKNAKGGRLRIHAVKIVMGGSLRGYEKTKCAFEELTGYIFGLPFMRKYGFLSSVNVLTHDGVGNGFSDPYSVALWNCLGRGMQAYRSVIFSPEDKDRLTEEATYNHIVKGMWNGYGGGISVDENALRSDSLSAINFSEAVWRIYEENPKNQINVFYADSSTGAVYDEPRQNVSEISSIVNSGDGRGLLCPEFYMPVTSDRASFSDFIDSNADFLSSALEMVPASRGRTILFTASFIMLGEWSNYYAPETDIKAHTAELLRAYATDPRFAECAGLGFGGIGCGNEEYVRWSMRLVRYYALEGGTEDLAAKYGYAWNPGFVKDPDFAKGFECWKVREAEKGSIQPMRIYQYGMRYQQRIGAPAGFGDTVAKFTVSKAGSSVLAQKLKGLKPGSFYSLQFNVMDKLPENSKEVWSILLRKPITLRAHLKGGEEILPLRYSHPIYLNPAVPEEERAKAIMRNERYVFRATDSEAILYFDDGAKTASADDIGRTYLLNYIIFTPYFCEGEQDVREIAAAIRGEEK